jgi:hypothetical protein
LDNKILKKANLCLESNIKMYDVSMSQFVPLHIAYNS